MQPGRLPAPGRSPTTRSPPVWRHPARDSPGDTVRLWTASMVRDDDSHSSPTANVQADQSIVNVGPAAWFARQSLLAQPDSLGVLAQVAADSVGASSGRLFIVDYGLRSVRALGADGTIGEDVALEGTIAGRAFSTGEPTTQGDGPVVVWWPLAEGSERIGLLELTFDDIATMSQPADVAEVVRMLVLLIVSGRRYTDVLLRARRAQPLSEAAEAQWDLLPPLSYTGSALAVSGILEPAYSIGGDSFDYAVNPGQLDFAIIDAIGHGLPAVLMASAAVNSLRNARRQRLTLDQAYRQADRRIADQFGHCYYVTGQIASLDNHGRLTWLNAGHVLPLLVRNSSLVGELSCRPSMPIGLGGPVVEIAVEQLQPGDRVLFHTDGVVESRSPDGTLFGTERLADLLVRATLDGVSIAETVRRLSASIVSHVGAGLRDDATLLLIEYCREP